MRISVSDEYQTIFPNYTCLEAAKLLNEKIIHLVVVDSEGNLQGIITKTDLIEKIIIAGKDPNKILVKDIMNKNVITINHDTDLLEAIKLMVEKEIFTLPLILDGKVSGVLSIFDSLKLLYQTYHHQPDLELPEKK